MTQRDAPRRLRGSPRATNAPPAPTFPPSPLLIRLQCPLHPGGHKVQFETPAFTACMERIWAADLNLCESKPAVASLRPQHRLRPPAPVEPRQRRREHNIRPLLPPERRPAFPRRLVPLLTRDGLLAAFFAGHSLVVAFEAQAIGARPEPLRTTCATIRIHALQGPKKKEEWKEFKRRGGEEDAGKIRMVKRS